MKTIVKIVASLSLGLFAVACQQFYVDTQMTAEQAVAKMECDALDSYTIQGDKPQAVSFKVASTTPWKITGFENAQWIKVSPTSSSVSSLSEDIVITAVANDTYENREVTLSVQGEGLTGAKQIKVTQLRKGKLFVQPVTDVYETNGSSQDFTIESNIAWEVRSSEQWLSFNENSGMGDGSVKKITATAAANKSIKRNATVTVSAGDEKFSFEVTQKGQSLDIVPVENPVIDRTGGVLEIGVKATMAWKVECSNPDFTAEQVGNDKVKVTAPFNNKFADRAATITIKPTTDEFGDIASTVEVSQGCNFDITGNCEVLADGSVKLSAGGDKARVVTKDKIRYGSFVLTMGDVHFGEKGHLCLNCHDGGASGKSELQCQINLDGNKRLRTNGGDTAYGTAKFTITQDDLNALKTYRVDFAQDKEKEGNIRLEFFYNGNSLASLSSKDPFAGAVDNGGHYFFGFESSKSDDSWYIVKSCDITIL